jgi:hypothetical protein
MQAHKVTDGGGGSPSEFNLVSQVKRQISTPQVYFRKVQWRYIPITKTKGITAKNKYIRNRQKDKDT